MAKRKAATPKSVETLKHEEATRKNIPTVEYQAVMHDKDKSPVRVAMERRNRDLDPQLVWRGKDEQDWSDLVVQAPPLYIQEKVQPKALVDDLMRLSKASEPAEPQLDLFADFNGIPEGADKTDFYQHDGKWSNRLILGDSLQVMASLAEREGLRGQVQCIYLDPPYGIKFNSNFQWSTTSRTVTDGKAEHITREPEQVKAFRDTWRDGIHSYLTYLRDRLTAARDLLAESGSIFVQIGDQNVHRVRALMDEVFGDENFIGEIAYHTTSGSTSEYISNPKNYVHWYAKSRREMTFRRCFVPRIFNHEEPGPWQLVEYNGKRFGLNDFLKKGGMLNSPGVRIARMGDATSQRQGREAGENSAMGFSFELEGESYRPSGTRGWSTTITGLRRAARASRLIGVGKSIGLVRYFDESPYFPLNSSWDDTGGTIGAAKVYVVQTNIKVIQRCILMATDPGDLVLDPTCGSGTTAYVAEQWGRRWITIDTSRVALALARARIMGARYPYYILADSPEGQQKVAEVTQGAPSSAPTHGNIRHGFVYERVPHITLKSIANNAEIDVIWERFQEQLEPLRAALNQAAGKAWEEWEIPRDAEAKWPAEAKDLHARWWELRIARQKEIDASIAAKADFEYLYDKPYEDKKTVRVSGPFTVESVSPHRVMGVDEFDELIDPQDSIKDQSADEADFVKMILANLKTAGVQQSHKDDKIDFRTLVPWPGDYICAEGRYYEGGDEAGTGKRAAIFIGPEFGTVCREDLVAAAREAGEAGFDVLIACAFNYDAPSADFNKMGRLPVLQARMNAELHMATDLKNTGKGNLFVIFGEPDIDILDVDDDQVQVRINGVDVFKPSTGEVQSDDTDGIACWFIDTDYNEESFFVRHAYFLGAGDPYKALKTTLKAEVNEEAWETLYSDVSRPFEKPKTGRIAVKVINHLGDEVMKVFRVS
ncbi:DNA methylase N-4/N-6 domain protein [Desulfarculus baarsii DSM 2075]|uniref:site-specific DNA-methyltransferase (adenine-specific) n=1 Tax=Desulfarculus baarsii (strain ATCC 33931 / DSM 2075 / LMG 7858 / VKM B-1802 / 2st14) TaxID=644282 RepID=E1QHC4_DESB2|nr:site-specific DNA-methyltransferase [Desulfarculus baarsii]ADK84967.1 DNA methylase N-4/N-6 domain protein [Desulfarculus baarsii DSM 2075]